MDTVELDKIYRVYGFKIDASRTAIRIYRFEEGRYYGADIIPLNDINETLEECRRLKVEYSNSGYAVQIRAYGDHEEAAEELYKSFFSYHATSKRIRGQYEQFARQQTKLNGAKYSYVKAPFHLNNEPTLRTDIVPLVVEILGGEGARLVIIEAPAGYGKTCTSYEILSSLLEATFCDNPLFTELSKNRGANIFKYILLDEIDREYPNLDSEIVTYEIQAGRIPLIIDGFDELLNKSDIVKSDREALFVEVETMLDTIGKLLKRNAKIILTTRKTALFASDQFAKWLGKWKGTFEVNRLSIEVPRIKDWLGEQRVLEIHNHNIPMEYIANPVLLTYLKNLDNTAFSIHLTEPNSIVQKYFHSLLKREMERQDLRIPPDDQYRIFRNVVKLMIEFNLSAEKRSFVKEILIDQNKDVLEKALALYPAGTNIDLLADKLMTHALLDRKGGKDDLIGFINDFVFGTFVGELMSEASPSEILSQYSPYMVELGATAYRVQNRENKIMLWQKIEALSHKFENHVLFGFDITLQGKLLRDFTDSIFHSILVFKIAFQFPHKIRSSVFISCKFKDCEFNVDVLDGVSFIECHFEDCFTSGGTFIEDAPGVYIIKCTEKNCNILHRTLGKEEDIEDDVKAERELLTELYSLEEKFQTQRIMHLMKKHPKGEHKKITQTIDRLEARGFISVSGSDMFIELNKLNEVKGLIGIK